jgi:hypothetical protein
MIEEIIWREKEFERSQRKMEEKEEIENKSWILSRFR